MVISKIFAWVAVFLVGLTAFRYMARVSRSEKWNHFFHKIHIPAGVLLIVMGLLHGLLAGNPAKIRWSEVKLGGVFFSFPWGTACFVVSALLGLTYLLRKQLRKNWMLLHRILTVAMLVLLVFHLFEVGIQRPSRFRARRGEKIITDILEQQSTEVDAVSGATYSSRGILEAVEEALVKN